MKAQATSASVDPSAWNTHLEIGPLAGWTAAWHPAPKATGVPLGAVVELGVRSPQAQTVAWSGARDLGHAAGRARALLRLDQPGLRTVTVRYTELSGEVVEESVRFEGIDLGAELPTPQLPVLEAEARVIDPADLNTSTLAAYFADDSIADLHQLAPGRYRTSTNRWLTARADLVPASLAPLLEWRVDGRVLRHLGGTIRLRLFSSGEHTVSAGAGPASRLETYRVAITGPPRGTGLSDGQPVTFTASTDPPGLESEIRWLASTRYGGCSPLEGSGPNFTVTFDQTGGPGGAWMGVKADSAVWGLDRKNLACANLQRAAVHGLPLLASDEDLPAEPRSLRLLLLRTRELAQDIASTDVCAAGRFDSIAGELEGQRYGFRGGFVGPNPFLPDFDSCMGECVESFDSCHWTPVLGGISPAQPECGITEAICLSGCRIELYAAAAPDLVPGDTPESRLFCSRTPGGLAFFARVRNQSRQAA
ncbi:MAG TPA: hypothetical protein PK413_15255, partial [Thermoanaerobaculia bacterium]|nr:hypothetical protein [Thermoanaerobaculia bacterium]